MASALIRQPTELRNMGVMSQQMPFINFLFLNCRFSDKYTLHVHLAEH